MEARSRYNPGYEGDSLRKFLKGEPDDLPWLQAWLGMVREATAVGRRFSRVRVVDLPMSDYNRFGFAVSRHNIVAGEDIRYLDHGRAMGLPDHDYWLFDSRTLVVMRFDDADRFVGGEVIDHPAAIVQHNYYRDAAWHQAVRRDDFATEPAVRDS